MENHISPNSLLVNKVRYSIAINYFLYAAMIILLGYWNLTRDTGIKPVVWLLQTFPLLAFLPGMLKSVYRAYSWLCFILLFYFILAVERVFSSISENSDYVFLTLVILLFISSMMTSRWLQRFQKSGR